MDRVGEFGASLTRRAVQQSLPSDWWINYDEEILNLQKIAIKVLSQTCSSSGCERNLEHVVTNSYKITQPVDNEKVA